MQSLQFTQKSEKPKIMVVPAAVLTYSKSFKTLRFKQKYTFFPAEYLI